ncbi:MAG: class I SAM-dependent methyltransferase [Microthrixaceae bacterium]
MNTNDRRLVELIEQLPEVYQPIFGHPELASSRAADSPRMNALVTTVSQLAEVAGRPLRIVDLGSAQGFTSCTLAASGHRVIGIDYLDANVAVARHLAGEHPELELEFFCGDVTDVASVIDLAEVDLVIGLSVLHHLVYRDGIDATRAFVETLTRHVPHGIYEMAVREEPVYWATAQPADPRVVLDSYAFIRELVHSGTHLSAVARPTLFCSTTHCAVDGRLVAIESFTRRSHALVGDAQSQLMRYVFWNGGITKTAACFDERAPSFVLETLRSDLLREARVLELLAAREVDAPGLVEFVDGVGETILSRTTFPGELLSEVVGLCSDAELRSITGDVLRELAALEQVGLYHGDLRLWNVVVDRQEGRARLIDHGAVNTDPTDVVWPFDPYFSFLAFFRTLWEAKADSTGAEVPRRSGCRRRVFPLTSFVSSQHSSCTIAVHGCSGICSTCGARPTSVPTPVAGRRCRSHGRSSSRCRSSGTVTSRLATAPERRPRSDTRGRPRSSAKRSRMRRSNASG